MVTYDDKTDFSGKNYKLAKLQKVFININLFSTLQYF